MNLAANKSALSALTRELLMRWEQTGDAWQDRKHDEFESLYMDKLSAGLNRTVAAVEEMDKLLTKIRRDCA
jgi:hypothetical protein